MAKHLKLNIKNTQIAKAIDLNGLKDKLAKKKAAGKQESSEPEKITPKEKVAKTQKPVEEEPKAALPKEEAPRIRARSKSVFAESAATTRQKEEPLPSHPPSEELAEKRKPVEELPRDVVQDVIADSKTQESIAVEEPLAPVAPPESEEPASVKLGPTGRHVKDLSPAKPSPKPKPERQPEARPSPSREIETVAKDTAVHEETSTKKGYKPALAKDFRDLKPARRSDGDRQFDARARQGLRDFDDEHRWRKRRGKSQKPSEEIAVVRPTSLKVRIPITIKDLAGEMKLKASELISKLFLQGVIVTLNDILDDETTIQLLGHEFGCEITIDTSEATRIRITDKSVKEEITSATGSELITRPPVIAFMGHVDHGKTSLIDAIRQSNRVAGEAGAITQHMGAFRCHTPVGDITILDTPGHEAFSAMRARGADVTDIVVLVVAGDEGIKQQTLEAIQHARSAKVTIVVAINKSDKPGFNPDNVYRQLADHELLPEVWGGQTLTVNCSAVTKAGIKELLETLALQAEVLELKANAQSRARGVVLESELHKGLGSVATVLVQNGMLKLGDSLVFSQHWGHVKTMRDEFSRNLKEAGPSTPVAITGLSGLPEAGEEFIVVATEREARAIAEARMLGLKQAAALQKKALTIENLLQEATPTTKKNLNIVLRADVQGSLEALKVALQKIHSDKAELNIIFAGVGEISESDIQAAATSKGIVLGFHTSVESHSDSLIKQLKVQVRLHDIIYHAIDDVKAIMTSLLDKIPQETERGKVEVKALFKSSQAGTIAGCQVTDGSVQRSHHIRVKRKGELVGTAQIASLRRVKDDVREVTKGQECGIALSRFSGELEVGDVLEAYEITYIAQEL